MQAPRIERVTGHQFGGFLMMLYLTIKSSHNLRIHELSDFKSLLNIQSKMHNLLFLPLNWKCGHQKITNNNCYRNTYSVKTRIISQ